MTINVMNHEFEKLVNEAPVVVIEFFATWCGHCQAMAPVVNEIKELLGDKAPVYQMDIDKYGPLADRLGVTGTPTFFIYRNGEQVWKYDGEIDGNVLLQKIQHYMN